ncbi:hypothetical protein cypCar_00043821 [Cyprinus carpio]|nr:hypothetical protein cypCar_00043821 [Cyprinus carpio]
MDESTFETFEEELGKPLEDVPPQKPVRQARTGGRAEMSAQRRVREEAPNVQQAPKMIPREHPVSGAKVVRGRKDVSEELTALHDRHALIKRGKITQHEPYTSLWDTLFWWIDDDDDDDEGKSKRVSRGRVSRGLRHRALPDLRLLKKRETKFTERRRRRRGRREEDETKERLTKEKEMKVKKVEEEEEEDTEEMKKPKKAVKESKLKQ